MPDIDAKIEEKWNEFEELSEEIISDEFDEYEEEKQESIREKREKAKERVEELKEMKDDSEELQEGGNEPIKPEPNQEHQEQLERADEVRSEEHYRDAFYEYAKYGLGQMKREDRKKLEEGRDPDVETRAQVTNNDDLGGFLIPEEMEESLTEARKDFGGMRQANTREISTEAGGPMPMPTTDDTSNEGEYIGEDTEVSEQTVSIGETTLESHILSSKKVPVSMALLNDNAVNLDSILGEMLGTRIGRRENRAFTTGSGTGEPHGVVPASTEGVADANSNTGFDENDFIDLKHSLDPAYRQNAQWMMNDNGLKQVKKITDGDNRHVLFEGNQSLLDEGQRAPTIDGDPVIINQDMANPDSDGNKSLLYGDFSRYWIRDVEGITLMRLNEVQATRLNVVFLAFARNDGNLIDAGGNPIKHLNQ